MKIVNGITRHMTHFFKLSDFLLYKRYIYDMYKYKWKPSQTYYYYKAMNKTHSVVVPLYWEQFNKNSQNRPAIYIIKLFDFLME